eukprot:166633-Amphidinium_carterae.1
MRLRLDCMRALATEKGLRPRAGQLNTSLVEHGGVSVALDSLVACLECTERYTIDIMCACHCVRERHGRRPVNNGSDNEPHSNNDLQVNSQ